ncbi:cysteine peptidase family C39 domain-containing protein [Thermococcus celer]|uniref:Peptidase C39-like domain-containing protein n=1 Tax=Thermococcus celer Vu 13 = JCM 8558 TaxID=1293037 RepID=A0A218P0H4_THECE|nr:hypothetical protein [Thermococcus celer]ASI98438.1 hypothetical protein A3L02_02080 [Thermococcus celer Vu 13 = JCM 8558]
MARLRSYVRVFFIVLIFGGLIGVSNTTYAKSEVSIVAPNEAMLVAQRHVQWASENVPDFGDWKDAKLSRPVVYYFPNGTRSAYEFTVLVNGKPSGFILVAAQRYMPPVLEFGKGEAPSKRLGRLGAARIQDFSTGGHRLLYYGGLSYGIDIGKGKAMDIYGRLVLVPKAVKLEFSREQVANAWRKIGASPASETNTKVLTESITLKIIPSVPVWTEDSYWTYNEGVGDLGGASTSYPNNVGLNADPWDLWDGCTPIAAAQIIAYHEHPEIYESGYYTEEYKRYMTSLVDILHHTMGTFDTKDRKGWTWWCGYPGSDACDGIESFASEYQKLKNEGIVSWSLVNNYDAQPTCTLGLCWLWGGYIHEGDVIKEVDNYRPALLQLENGGKATDGQGPYEDHSVVVVGYAKNSNGQVEYVAIHSGWDMYDHYLAWGNWGSKTHLVKIIPEKR